MSLFSSRAGLVYIFLIFALLTFTGAAPLPTLDSHQKEIRYPQHSRLRSDVHSVEHGRGLNIIQYPVQLARESSGNIPNDNPVQRQDTVHIVRRNIFSKIKHAFQKMAHGIKHIAQKIGHGIKHVAEKIGSGIKHVAKKIGKGIVTAAKKVGHFVKTTGAKIVKFGLKLYSAAAAVASKVLNFVPVIGKPLSKLADGASAASNAISNKIHVKLPGKLEHGVRVLDKVRKIAGYIPRDLEALEDEVFEREMLEMNELAGRDLAYGLNDEVYLREFVPSVGDLDERDGVLSAYDSVFYVERGWAVEDEIYYSD